MWEEGWFFFKGEWSCEDGGWSVEKFYGWGEKIV